LETFPPFAVCFVMADNKLPSLATVSHMDCAHLDYLEPSIEIREHIITIIVLEHASGSSERVAS
jgi:hypothetical protein